MFEHTVTTNNTLLQPPNMMHGSLVAPPLAGGPANEASSTVAMTTVLLGFQEQRYGNGEQPPVLSSTRPMWALLYAGC